jgi:hypothetical protein
MCLNCASKRLTIHLGSRICGYDQRFIIAGNENEESRMSFDRVLCCMNTQSNYSWMKADHLASCLSVNAERD